MKRCHRALRAFRLSVAAFAVATALHTHAAMPEVQPAGQATEALAAGLPPGTGLARRPDERRPGKGTVVELFGQPIQLAGEYEGTHDGRFNFNFNFDLDRADRADRAELEQELKLEGDSVVDTWRQSGTKQRQNALERDQAWGFRRSPAATSGWLPVLAKSVFLWSLPGPARPTAWFGWAAGSGDGNEADEQDLNLRLTARHDNKDRLGGVKRFHYYGDLFRPELGNLGVASLGLGARFFGNSSVDLVLHDYRQRRVSARFAPNRLGSAAGGVDPHLGREVDVFFAFRETTRLDFTLSLATFRAGRAYGTRAGERAGFAEVGVIWGF